MILKNLTDNAKNLAANAKIEDMSRLFMNSVAGKQDVKSDLSGVMVTPSCVLFSLANMSQSPFDEMSPGIREEPDTEAVRCPGRCPGYHQAVLPRRGQRTQEELLRKIARTAIAALCAVVVHSDDRYANQDVCHHSDQSR